MVKSLLQSAKLKTRNFSPGGRKMVGVRLPSNINPNGLLKLQTREAYMEPGGLSSHGLTVA